MGKGDKPRPIRDRERYDRNWERIFGEGAGQQAIRQGESPTETRQPAPDPDINPAEWEDAHPDAEPRSGITMDDICNLLPESTGISELFQEDKDG